MAGPLVTRSPTSTIAHRFLNVEVGDVERIVLDELPARLDQVAADTAVLREIVDGLAVRTA